MKTQKCIFPALLLSFFVCFFLLGREHAPPLHENTHPPLTLTPFKKVHKNKKYKRKKSTPVFRLSLLSDSKPTTMSSDPNGDNTHSWSLKMSRSLYNWKCNFCLSFYVYPSGTAHSPFISYSWDTLDLTRAHPITCTRFFYALNNQRRRRPYATRARHPQSSLARVVQKKSCADQPHSPLVYNQTRKRSPRIAPTLSFLWPGIQSPSTFLVKRKRELLFSARKPTTPHTPHTSHHHTPPPHPHTHTHTSHTNPRPRRRENGHDLCMHAWANAIMKCNNEMHEMHENVIH